MPAPKLARPLDFAFCADLLLSSLDAARWSLSGAEKKGRKLLEDAVMVAREVRQELEAMNGVLPSALEMLNRSHRRLPVPPRRISASEVSICSSAFLAWIAAFYLLQPSKALALIWFA